MKVSKIMEACKTENENKKLIMEGINNFSYFCDKKLNQKRFNICKFSRKDKENIN